jgi:rhodanese-related sulfurtransferase
MGADYTPAEVAGLVVNGNVQLIDVRTPHEHEAGRIDGDRLIELADLPQQAGTIDPDRPVIFYCRSGGRSAMATQALSQAGFDAHNMVGGMLAWAAAGLPMVPDRAQVIDP